MESNSTNFPLMPLGNTTLQDNATLMAMSHIMYRIGEGINKFYLPILVPIGVIGNTLSFLVMVQRRNRHMSFSLYISALAVSDTLVLLCGFLRYLNLMGVDIPPNKYWFCTIQGTLAFIGITSVVLILITMTFDRFYSILQPHKAVSFNTVKRAKITIICIVFSSILFNVPHLFTSFNIGRVCHAYANASEEMLVYIYYWLGFMVDFAIPFVSLLIMNSVIIHILRKRSMLSMMGNEDRAKGQTKGKLYEKQIFVLLLLVTFSFLFLNTPVMVMVIYIQYAQGNSPSFVAGQHLFYHVSEKLYMTNHAVNFFLYVLSGHKFRSDLVKLFHRQKNEESMITISASVSTVTRTTESL